MSVEPSQQEMLPLEWRRQVPSPCEVPTRAASRSGALHRWIGQVSTGVAEVAAGVRPARQLFLIMSPGAVERLQRLAAVHPSGNGPIRRVLSVRVSHPGPGTMEAIAVVEGARRCQAVALQLRRRRQGWLVTAAEIR